MKMFYLVAALLLLAAPAAAQSQNDLVRAWLATHGIAFTSADYSTCQPEGQADGICTWNATKLGAQPTPDQLAALAPTVANTRQAQQYQTIIAQGLSVTSTGTPALSATYGVDQTAQLNIDSQIASILTNATFTNGQTTRVWHDAVGMPHTFTVDQFKAFATAVAAYVDAVMTTYGTLATGQAASWPPAVKTIP